MSKTWLSVITALILIGVALVLHLARRSMLGSDLGAGHGLAVWKVTLSADGLLAGNEATLSTPRPLDFRRQHIFDEKAEGNDLSPPHGKKSRHLNMVWRRSSPGAALPFHLTYSFRCLMGMHKPTPAMVRLTHLLDAAPPKGADINPTTGIESSHRSIAFKASTLIQEGMSQEGEANAFFTFVDGLDQQPGQRTALECLHDACGDSEAKSRLLVALCRNRSIPARLVSGLVLEAKQEQTLHYWAEAWINNHWLPMCPTYHYFGMRKFPKNYLVLHIGGQEPFHGHGPQFQYAFNLQEIHPASARGEDQPQSAVQTFWHKVSLYTLRPGEQHVVKFLLLLPLAALIVTIFRTLIGVPTFGTFSPALVGLAFLDLKALPYGLGIFVGTVLVGWGLRRLLERYHLLLVPRTAVLLTLIVIFLIIVIVVASANGVPTTQYISLFPLVILTHLVERFWTVEAEDGTVASFKTLIGTLVVAVTISIVLSPDAVTSWMFRYPETLGVVLGFQFLLGRYTGYRVAELYRFRDLIQDPPAPGGPT